MLTVPRRVLVSFGIFEVDLGAGEIRRAGMRIHLAGQPFRILATLLSRPGELISREELQQEVWGAGTTVDFERGIASAVNKIREALGDSADNPRYIETLAKRGYRFIAPVTRQTVEDHLPEPERSQPIDPVFVLPSKIPRAPGDDPLGSKSTPAPQPSALSATGDLPMGGRPRLPWHLKLLFFACLLLLVALTSVVTHKLTRKPKTYRPPRIEQLTVSNAIYSGPPNLENLLTLVSDGPRIYTSVLFSGRSQVSSIDLNSLQVDPLTLPDELKSLSVADISRDGSKLIVRSGRSRESEQSLWVVPTVGSSALPVGDVLAHDATWMPGENSVLYASGNQLGIAKLDSGAVLPFATLSGRAFWPRWSPRGDVLRFTLVDPVTHTSSIWEIDAHMRNLRRLEFPELAGLSLCCGSWTGDGSAFVFQGGSTQESNIWMIENGTAAKPVELTNGPLRYMSPLPAHGSRILYFVGLEQPAGTQIYDQRRREFIPAPSFLAQARRVTYSRDGKWTAWIATDGKLWRARNPDGSGRVRLTEDDLEVFLAQWSPDGQQLVLMARKPGETWQIYVVSATNGSPRKVLSDQRNLADPDWSPDGAKLVFGREADLMGKESGPHTIQIIDLITRHVETLPGSENLFSPRWSPDGRWIAALSLDQTRLLLHDMRSGVWRTLFTGGAADPVWSRDSKTLVFHAFAQPNSAILRVSLDGIVRPVSDLSSLRLPSVDNYFFSGITPDGSPLVQPRIGKGNLYSVDLGPKP